MSEFDADDATGSGNAAITNVWSATFHDPITGRSVELVTEPAEIPAVPAGGSFTITWGSDGTARFELADDGLGDAGEHPRVR